MCLSKYQQNDKLIWVATTMGEFTVKSAYHLEKEIQDRKKGECSNLGANHLKNYLEALGAKFY
jgi:hypothetical protein